MTSTAKLTIDELSIDRPAGADLADQVVWRRNSEAVEKIRDDGSNYGRILVSLCVDGQYDIVEADTRQTSDIEALERAITAMQEIRDALVSSGHTSEGLCMATGDWGRCQSPTGHELPHDFPTEQQWRADFDALRPSRERVTA